MDKLDVKTFRLLKKAYNASKHKKHFMIKNCRERRILFEKELIYCTEDIQKYLDNLLKIPERESIIEKFERLKRDSEIPATYHITDKGIEYYYKHHSERLEKIIPLVLSAIAIAISIIGLIF